MKPIIEYHDYRLYMQDFCNERIRVSVFSWREFSRISGFSSPNYLKLVCDGKTRLSPHGAEKVGTAMGLVGFELEYFEKMVTYCDAKNDQLRKLAFDAMLELAASQKVKIVDGEAFRYFESWVHPVVRELAPVMEGATPGEIAKRCCKEVTANDVRESLDFMVKVGLLKRNGHAYEQTDKYLKGTTGVVSVALRSMHREMAAFAEKAIDEFDVSERNFSGLIMGLSAEDYEKIVQKIKAFRKEIAEIALKSRATERVYRLNLQLFPLTWKNGENND